jgi:GNAT superfamily N-acetyltransferase
MRFSIHRLRSGEAAISEDLLRSLPRWFGVEAAIRSYRLDIERMETYVARTYDETVGFVTIRQHGEHGAKIQLMAVSEEYHRLGTGRALVSHVEAKMRESGIRFLLVKTLGPSHPDRNYEKTRRFYKGVGFRPLEETTAIWGEEHPCLIMVKRLKDQHHVRLPDRLPDGGAGPDR